MDSVSCLQANKTDDSSQKSCENLDENGCLEADKGKVEPPLEPITPDSKVENGDFLFEFNSPLSFGKRIPRVLVFNSKPNGNKDADDSGSPRTPNDCVFDPFAPGPDDKVLAPQCKKYFDEARASVARRLDFSSSFKTLGKRSSENDAESISDEEMFESVYENLLEVIVSNQTEDALAELSGIEWAPGACKTPTSIPLLNGVSDTCPGAPMKRGGGSRAVDLGLCRRLEF
ncbi:hypothetical protein Tsubulata_000074 [Turnera subulata]|uniref:Uncharacterized protein n=1 Tax=Turnera subulata TaxID=218843 RepID=A0A9Q0J7M6_9ROSI|nr:hypothetical protein Tsubulata_000074 [Turnera subulata]